MTEPDGGSRNAVRRPAPTGLWARTGWAALLVSAVARAGLFLLAGLLLWSVAPVAAGWSSSVVMSNSMAPRLLAGDVVLVRPIDPGQLRTGQVLLVDDPDRTGRLRLHRLDGIDPATGILTLKGDANSRADSTPVRPEAVHGIAALRVPWVGTPMLWLQEGHLRLVAWTAIALAGLVAGVFHYRPEPLPALPGSSRTAETIGAPAAESDAEPAAGLPSDATAGAGEDSTPDDAGRPLSSAVPPR
jgi:signal peptidase